MGKRGSITRSIATQGAVILGHVDSSVISSGVLIEGDAEVKRCVVMENAKIRRGAVIHNAIVAPEVEIKENERINVNGEEVVLVDSGWENKK